MVSQMSNYDRKLMDINLKNAEMDSEMKEIELYSARRRLGQGGQTGVGLPDDISPQAAKVTSHVGGRPRS